MFDRPHLGRLLLSHGIVSEEQLEQGLQYQTQHRCRLGEALIRLGLCSEVDIARTLAEQMDLPFIDLQQTPPVPRVLRLLSREKAQEYQVIPVRMEGDRVVVVARNPLDLQIDDAVRKATGKAVIVAAGCEAQIREVLAQWDNLKWITTGAGDKRSAAVSASVQQGPARPLVAASEQAQTVQMVDSLIAQAVRRGATEVSFEGQADGLHVRGRIDGHLHSLAVLPLPRMPGVITRLKIMSGIPLIAEGATPSGFLETRVDGRPVRLLCEVLRTAAGEMVVLRTATGAQELVPLEDLGMTPTALGGIRRVLVERHGLILVSGPVDSGRGTTLYALLAHLASESLRVVTVELGVGQKLPGVTHLVASDPSPGAINAALQRALAQNPDVLYVADVPDRSGAEAVCRAAIDGRLVLCGSRSPSALGAVARLMDLGLPAHFVAAALRAAIAQKLLRRVCPACAVEHPLGFELDRALRATFGTIPNAAFRRGRGCVACHQMGASGRVGAFEVLHVDDDVRRLIADRAMPSVLREHLSSQGFITLEEDAFDKAVEGLVSPDEILHMRAGVAARVAEAGGRPRPVRRGDLDTLSAMPAGLATAEPPFAELQHAPEPEVESWDDVADLAGSLAI